MSYQSPKEAAEAGRQVMNNLINNRSSSLFGNTNGLISDQTGNYLIVATLVLFAIGFFLVPNGA